MPLSFQSMYGEDKELTLYPYTPAEPHGTSQYACNPLPPDLPRGWIRGFDPSKHSPQSRRATIEINELLSGGDDSKGQILACSVRTAPSRQEDGRPIPSDPKHIVAKVFDPQFYGADCGPPFQTARMQADGNLSREAGAYKYLFEHNLTGGMQLVPEYYGCWATKFVVGKNEDGSSKFRCVGLILMEYLYCASITELCDRDEEYEFLVPEKGGIIYATPEETENGKNGLKVNLALRKAVIRMVIRGIVLHSHVGVKTVFVLPENNFVTACKDPLGNLVPQAVMLDYSITEVHSKTKDATDPDCYPKDDLELPPHPIHPLERFNAGILEQFYGWYPLTGLKWSEKRQAYCGEEFDEKGEFIKWLADEFGPLVEGQNDKGEYYSTYDKLNAIIEKLNKEEAEKAEALEKAQPDTTEV